MLNYVHVVHATLAAFASPIVTAAQEEEAKAQLTRRVALTLYQQMANIGLLRKDSGNQVAGLSVDVLIDRLDGSWVDMASATLLDDGNVRITAQWTAHEANSDPEWLSRWVRPTAALANLPGPMTVIGAPIPGPVPPIPTPTPPQVPRKVRIRTAHGYLSFQPDGRLEYRDVAGPWEHIDVEGWEG